MGINFNPRAPHGGATDGTSTIYKIPRISIHAPRMGARLLRVSRNAAALAFQSTRPAWGRDDSITSPQLSSRISIHAPRMGARQGDAVPSEMAGSFQSTRPAWGRDVLIRIFLIVRHKFQSTRPAWGRDSIKYILYCLGSDFNPRAPHGGATVPVYTGLITAVALYFSRTSFWAVLLQAFFVAKSSV